MTGAGLILLAAGLLAAAVIRWTHPPYAGEVTRVDPGYHIDVNAAEADELRLLHGVGPALADNVIAYREQHGPFTRPVDLEAVSRIGPTTRLRIEPWIRFE